MLTKSKVFIDSNVFIYLFDKDEKEKQQRCAELLQELEEEHTLVISTQVVKEVSSILLRKFKYPVTDLKTFINHLEKFEVVETPIHIISKGLDLMLTNQLSFWDSLICASAESANCAMIITEDMNDGQLVAGMKIQSPFTIT